MYTISFDFDDNEDLYVWIVSNWILIKFLIFSSNNSMGFNFPWNRNAGTTEWSICLRHRWCYTERNGSKYIGLWWSNGKRTMEKYATSELFLKVISISEQIDELVTRKMGHQLYDDSEFIFPSAKDRHNWSEIIRSQRETESFPEKLTNCSSSSNLTQVSIDR